MASRSTWPLWRISLSRPGKQAAEARRGARMIAIMNGGAIPETALYTVVAEPEGTVVGTLHEDFAVESLKGDIVLLGNMSWRIGRVESAGAFWWKMRTARHLRFLSGWAKRRDARKNFLDKLASCARRSAI